MRLPTLLALFACAAASGFAAQPAAPSKRQAPASAKSKTILAPHGPTIRTLPGFAVAHLRFNVSPKLLIYKIADGITAVNFSHNEQAYYAGHQRTDVWVGVWKDGKWTTVGGTKRRREYPQPGI